MVVQRPLPNDPAGIPGQVAVNDLAIGDTHKRFEALIGCVEVGRG